VCIAYKSFDDYMAKALSKATRKDLRRKFKAAQGAALKMTVVEDVTPFIDEVYPLYLNVYKRSKLHFEKLTKEYLCELGRRMPERTRFFLWHHQGRVVAFNLCMVHNDAIYDQYIGLDYSVALDLHLYHYTIRDIMGWAMAQGYRWYRSNGLNYDPKLHLRMQLDPLDLYVRHRWTAANAILKIVLPLLEPTQYDKNLRKFANYSELRGS
jgi:predicted N-acyltransferase